MLGFRTFQGFSCRKKSLLFCLAAISIFLLFASPLALAGDNGWKMQDSVTLSKGTGEAYTTVCAAGSSYDAVSRAIPYSHGLFAVALSISGGGTAKVTYEVSPDNVHWFAPVGASSILNGVTSALPKYAQFSPDFAFWIRFTVTERGGGSSLTGGTLFILSD